LTRQGDILEADHGYRSHTIDYGAIADLVLHMRYTAREGGAALKQAAIAEMKADLDNLLTVAEGRNGFFRMFSIRHEFPGEWQRFLHPANATDDQTLTLELIRDRFPFQPGCARRSCRMASRSSGRTAPSGPLGGRPIGGARPARP
jgi:hypothetical protein